MADHGREAEGEAERERPGAADLDVPSAGAMGGLRRLWRGDVPLERAFWTYAVFGGLVVNIVSSALFWVLVLADLPLAAIAIGYGVSLPYNLVALVGVWRAADRHEESDRARATAMRIVTLVGMVLLSVT